METEVCTKKCSVSVLKKVRKVKPDASERTNWEQAWIILADAYNLSGTLSAGKNTGKFIIYKDDEVAETVEWNKPVYDYKIGDFLYDIVYKDVPDTCIKKKLLKKSLLKKSKKTKK